MAERAKVAVLISGSGTNMAALLYASRAADCPFELALVASNNPQAAGLAMAAAEGVATFALGHEGMDRAAHDMAMDSAIRASGANYVALAGYMRILTDDFVARWHGRMVNIHPSLLPKYPGLHTHERALAAGDRYGGCSVHLVTPQLLTQRNLAKLIYRVNLEHIFCQVNSNSRNLHGERSFRFK